MRALAVIVPLVGALAVSGCMKTGLGGFPWIGGQVSQDYKRASHTTTHNSRKVANQVTHDFVRMKRRLSHEYDKLTDRVNDTWDAHSIDAAREAMEDDRIPYNEYVVARLNMRNQPPSIAMPGITNSAFSPQALSEAPGPREVIAVNNLTLMRHDIMAQHVARYAQQCWSQDADFASRYRFSGLEDSPSGTQKLYFVDQSDAPALTLYVNHGTVMMGYVISASGRYDFEALAAKVHAAEYALKNRIYDCA